MERRFKYNLRVSYLTLSPDRYLSLLWAPKLHMSLRVDKATRSRFLSPLQSSYGVGHWISSWFICRLICQIATIWKSNKNGTAVVDTDTFHVCQPSGNLNQSRSSSSVENSCRVEGCGRSLNSPSFPASLLLIKGWGLPRWFKAAGLESKNHH